MRKQSTLVYGLALLVGDFLAVLAAFVVAYLVRVKVDVRPLLVQIPGRTYVGLFAALVPFWLIIFSTLGLYRKDVWASWWHELWRLAVGSFAGILFIIGYDFVSDEPVFPARLVALYALLLGFGLLVLERAVLRGLRRLALRYGIGAVRVMVIGDSDLSLGVVEELTGNQLNGYHVSAVVASKRNIPQGFKGKIFHSLDQAMKSLDKLDIEGIVQTDLSPRAADNERIISETAKRHLEYRFVPQQTSALVAHSELELFAGIPMLTLHQTKLIGWGQITKRSFDLVVSVPLLILLSPVFLIIAISQKVMEWRAPIFFRQTRLTRFNRKFKAYKFRTQYSKFGRGTPEDDFALMGQPELAKQFRANGDYLPNDPRITPLGRFLRRTSLDELPQLFNVLKGDISLVGPRALIPQDLEKYERKFTILSVKSGMTGLAQISGRKDISFDERRRLDLYYVQNWSFWWDVLILIKTVRVALLSSGDK